jgi:exopolysaccharide biosynthesis polyprenyl glycosylphosphotransferase
LAFDIAVVFFSLGIASFVAVGDPGWNSYFLARLDLAFLLALAAVTLFYLSDIYPSYRNFTSYSGLIQLWDALVYIFLVQGFVTYVYGSVRPVGRVVFASALVAQGILFTLSKLAISLLAREYAPRERAVIVGYNPAKEFYFHFLKETEEKKFPFEIMGIVCGKDEERFLQELPFPVLGEYREIEEIVRTHQANILVLTSTYSEKESLQEFLIRAHQTHSRLVSLETLYEEMTKKVPYDQVNKTELLNKCLLANKFAQLKKKRVFDLVFALFFLILLFPIGCLAAFAIKLTSKGPIFFLQERVGFRGNVFKLIKFRTMRRGAEEGTGAVFAARNDPRVTPVGRFLRKSRLDEMPQLINVLKGEMSIVGPRPEREEFIRELEKKIPIYALRLFTKPGMAGWALVHQGYASSLKDLEEKFCFDLYYLEHMTLSFDTKILLMTMGYVLLGKGQ